MFALLGLGLFQRLEGGGFLEPHPNDDGDDDQYGAEQEGHSPEPAEQDVAAGQCQQCEGAGAEQGADLDADEGQRSEEAAAFAWCELRDQHGGTGLFGPGAEALGDPQRDQQDGAPDADGVVRRQHADQHRRAAHQGDGDDQDDLAPDLVAHGAEHQAADRAGREAHRVGAQCGDGGAGGAERLEEQFAENQCAGEAVDVEVVVLQGGADGRGEGGPTELDGIDDVLLFGGWRGVLLGHESSFVLDASTLSLPYRPNDGQ